MIVSMWMTRDVVTIEPGTPVIEVAAIMAEKHIRRLPVLEKQAHTPHPIGIITATDILHACPPDVNPFAIASAKAAQTSLTAAAIMSRSLQTVTPETPIEEAARIMRDRKISTLLVMQKVKLVGLITESDIFRAFASIFEFAPGDVRITFEITTKEDIFSFIAPIALRWSVRIDSLISLQQDDRKLCVVRLTGAMVDKMLDELWQSGYSVLNVLRLP